MTSSIKMDNVRLEQADTRSGGASGPTDPGQGAKDKFDEAMTGRKDGERGKDGQSGQGGDKDGDPNAQAMPSAASLFSSMFESRMGNVGAAAQVSAPDGDMGELVDKLVDRILVSEPKAGNQAEVRIQLNDTALRDTEIILNRGADGLLSVRLVTDNASSMQTLVAAQQGLKEQLEKHGPASVQVQSPGESRSGDNDSNRRSQGMVDYEPENV